jgi:hypothetical protein
MTFKKALAVFAFLTAGLSAYAYDDGDWQFWNTDGVEYKATDKTKLSFETEEYFGDDMTDFYYWHVQPAAAISPAPWIETGVNYRYVEAKSKDEWLSENRPAAFVTLIQKIAGFTISDRNQIEYRSLEDTGDTWRYRNKLKVVAPWKLTKFEIRPYADEEIYVDTDDREFQQNRASASTCGSRSSVVSPGRDALQCVSTR